MRDEVDMRGEVQGEGDASRIVSPLRSKETKILLLNIIFELSQLRIMGFQIPKETANIFVRNLF